MPSIMHNGTTYMLQIHERTIHKNFVICLVLMEVIFPCFDLKPDNCNLPTTIGISLIVMGLIFSKIHPGSITDFNITEKNSMWLTGFTKKDKDFVTQYFSSRPIKDVFWIGHARKIIQFSEAEVAANFDVTPISIHVQRFTGQVYDWSVLNNWPIQKIDLLTSTWGSLRNILK